MTANVAQAIVDAEAWRATLRGVHRALRPGGHLVLETRDPAYGAWRGWTRAQTYRTADVPGIGVVEGWEEVSDVSWPLVTFTSTRVFDSDGTVLTSGSTLRFRERGELAEALSAAGYDLEDVRGAPDRVGRELVFLARRPESGDGVR